MSIIYKAKSRRSGFTLVELVCVFVIMAVLTAMIVPVSMKWIEKVRVSRYISEARGVWDSVRLYAVETYVSGTLDTMELMEELNTGTAGFREKSAASVFADRMLEGCCNRRSYSGYDVYGCDRNRLSCGPLPDRNRSGGCERDFAGIMF